MPDIKAIIGLQRGMEGKEKVAAYFAKDSDIAISIAPIPSGIENPETMNIIGAGAIFQPDSIVKHLSNSNLFIDERAQILMPYHEDINQALYDRYLNKGLSAADIMNDERLISRLSKILPGRSADYKEILERCKSWRLELADFIIDTLPIVKVAVQYDQSIVLEGKDGFMNDAVWGSEDSISPISASLADSALQAGIPASAISDIYGVASVREEEREWIDVAELEYASYLNGATELILTGLSLLDKEEIIKVCIGYQIEGEYFSYLTERGKQKLAKPIYADFEGWLQDTQNIKEYSELPEKCVEYLNEIEKYVNIPVSLFINGKIISKS